MFNLSRYLLTEFPITNLTHDDYLQWFFEPELDETTYKRISSHIVTSITLGALGSISAIKGHRTTPKIRNLALQAAQLSLQFAPTSIITVFKIILDEYDNTHPLIIYTNSLIALLERSWLNSLTPETLNRRKVLKNLLSADLTGEQRRKFGYEWLAIQKQIQLAIENSNFNNFLKQYQNSLLNTGPESELIDPTANFAFITEQRLNKLLNDIDPHQDIGALQIHLLEAGLMEAFTQRIGKLTSKVDATNATDKIALQLFDKMIADFISNAPRGIWRITPEAYFRYDWTDTKTIDTLRAGSTSRNLGSWVVGAFDQLVDEIDEKFNASSSASTAVERLFGVLDHPTPTKPDKDLDAKLVLIYKLWQILTPFKVVKNDPLLGTGGMAAPEYYIEFHFQHRLLEQLTAQFKTELGIDLKPYIDSKLALLDSDHPEGLPINILRNIYMIKLVLTTKVPRGMPATIDAATTYLGKCDAITKANYRGRAEEMLHKELQLIMKDFLNFISKIKKSRTEFVFQSTPLLGIGLGGGLHDPSSSGMDYHFAFSFTESIRTETHYKQDSFLLLELLQMRIKVLIDSRKIPLPDSVTPSHSINIEDQAVQKYILKRIASLMITNPDHIDPRIYQKWMESLSKSTWIEGQETNLQSRITQREEELRAKQTHLEQLQRLSRVNESSITKAEQQVKNAQQALTELQAKYKDWNSITHFTHGQILHFQDPVWVEKNLTELLEKHIRIICIEPTVSRHTHNNLYLAVPLAPSHPDEISIDGTKVTLGKYHRPAITPCLRFCQLLAGAHMVWALLTDPAQSTEELMEIAATRQSHDAPPKANTATTYADTAHRSAAESCSASARIGLLI